MKPFEQQNYYELLEVPVSAPPEEIRAAYSRLMELYAPDSIAVYALVDPEQVDTLRARMTEAMEILTDEDLRAEYDKELGVPGQRMVEAATAAGSPPAGAAPEQRAVVRAAEALATAAEALASAAAEGDTAAEARSPEPVASARTEEGTAQEAPSAPASETAPVGAGDFRTAFFRGFSFAYVTSSLQGTGVVGSSVYVPPSTVQPEAHASPSEPVSEAARDTPGTAAEAPARAAGNRARTPVPAPAQATPSSSIEPSEDVARLEPRHPGESDEAPARAAERRSSDASEATAPAAGSGSGEPVPAMPDPANEAVEAAGRVPPGSSGEAPAPAAESAPTEPAAVPVAATARTPVTGPAAVPVAATARTPVTGPSAQPPKPASNGASRAERASPATSPGRAVPPPLPGRMGTARPSAEAQTAPEQGRQAQRPSSGRQLGEAEVIAQDSAIATAESALALVAARVREPQPPPPQQQPQAQRPRNPDIPSDAEFNGELLRSVREARGYSLQQVADRTRISSRHLENVEADRYAALPAPVYLRGILMNLARELGLDPLRVSRSYLALASEKAGKK